MSKKEETEYTRWGGGASAATFGFITLRDSEVGQEVRESLDSSDQTASLNQRPKGETDNRSPSFEKLQSQSTRFEEILLPVSSALRSGAGGNPYAHFESRATNDERRTLPRGTEGRQGSRDSFSEHFSSAPANVFYSPSQGKAPAPRRNLQIASIFNGLISSSAPLGQSAPVRPPSNALLRSEPPSARPLPTLQLDRRQMAALLGSLGLLSAVPSPEEEAMVDSLWKLLCPRGAQHVPAPAVIELAKTLTDAQPQPQKTKEEHPRKTREANSRGIIDRSFRGTMGESSRRALEGSSQASKELLIPRTRKSSMPLDVRRRSTSGLFEAGVQLRREEARSSRRDALSSSRRQKVLERAQQLSAKGLMPAPQRRPLSSVEAFELETRVKDAELALRRIGRQREEMVECTFRPDINALYSDRDLLVPKLSPRVPLSRNTARNLSRPDTAREIASSRTSFFDSQKAHPKLNVISMFKN